MLLEGGRPASCCAEQSSSTLRSVNLRDPRSAVVPIIERSSSPSDWPNFCWRRDHVHIKTNIGSCYDFLSWLHMSVKKPILPFQLRVLYLEWEGKIEVLIYRHGERNEPKERRKERLSRKARRWCTELPDEAAGFSVVFTVRYIWNQSWTKHIIDTTVQLSATYTT